MVMKKGSILGYDINEKSCQISYYDETNNEPQTVEYGTFGYQIPLCLGYVDESWVYGEEAEKQAEEGQLITDLFTKAIRREKVVINGRKRDGVWLLAKFIELTLEPFEKIDFLTFTTPSTNIDMCKMFKGIGRHLGLGKNQVYAQDYKESFCYYMQYQPKELWQYEAAMFYCDGQKINAYMLRRLNAMNASGKEQFVTVDEVASAHINELEALSCVMNEEKGKTADETFKAFIQSVFEKKVISSVFLAGEGFEKKWYPDSLKILCNGRRAFMGNNLYSRGACYTAVRKSTDDKEGPIYLDETRMMEQISLRMRVEGKEGWYPIVSWGTHWYEADSQWEVILEDASDIEIHIESLVGEGLRVEKLSLEGLEERRDYSLRAQIDVMFFDERTCKISFRDIGFGEFFPATGFYAEKVLDLGGMNGEFNSLSQ